jgi:epoxyqueuosine reductase
MQPAELSKLIKSVAVKAGFDWCGIAPAVRPDGFDRFLQWIESGFHGEMEWMGRRKELYTHPDSVLESARSVVMLAMCYRTDEMVAAGPGQGQVSRYAWGGTDYHDLIHERLRQMRDELAKVAPGMRLRGVVDTAPLLEREFAVLAGVGWKGKNTLLLNRQLGSWFFLAALLLDQEAEYDAPHDSYHCGSCRACLDACPTQALVAPDLLDARKCISYLTIELKGPIPLELRAGMGNWLFGCDVCQDVCPWNNKAPKSGVGEFSPADGANPVDLRGLFFLDDDAFRQRFRHTPLWRPRRRGILRNAAIVLGNQRDILAVEALSKGLNDDEPLVRGASAWSLGEIGGNDALLRDRFESEADPQVKQEIERALKRQE